MEIVSSSPPRPMHGVVLDPSAPRREALVERLVALGLEAVGYPEAASARAAVFAGVDQFFVSTDVGEAAVLRLFEALSASACVPPTAIVYGPISARAAFALGRLGVTRLIDGAATAEDVGAAGRASPTDRPPDLDRVVAEHLPSKGLMTLRHQVRSAMLRQALALAGGSLSGAARMLRVSRQAVQQLVQEALSEDR